MNGQITDFTLENVRCFKGEQTLRIRPITLLIGENSTGKSTVLGCYNALIRSFDEKCAVNFNEDVCQMSASGDVVRTGEKSFTLGVKYGGNGNSIHCQCEFAATDGVEPSISKVIYAFYSNGSVGGSMTCIPSSSKSSRQESFQVKKDGNQNNFIVKMKLKDLHPFKVVADMPLFLKHAESEDAKALLNFLNNFSKEFLEKERASVQDMMKLERIINTAPSRSKPRRKYDSANTEMTLERDGIPVYLMQLKRAKDAKWNSLRKSLIKFGASSGMFKDIDVKTSGETTGDSFQIKVKTNGSGANIMDVGYGVSQLLPILVRMMAQKNLSPDSRLLLQQPESHLHPRVQAELASLLVEFAKDGKGLNYLIETHSDYIVDRVAVEIRRGNISPDNVSLVYHESKNGGVKIHNIEFDERGELVDVPPKYQQFFTQEACEFLGLEL